MSVSACPAPHHAPRRAAAPVARSRPDATSVVTAAMWSGSVACRSPRRAATTTTTPIDPPSDSPAIQSSSPNITSLLSSAWTRVVRRVPGSGSDDSGNRLQRDREADDNYDEGRQRGERSDHRAVEAYPPERATGEHGDEAD